MPENGQPRKAPPRILFFDDNVRDIGGHYLELASLLCDGANALGYDASLVTHRSLANRVRGFSHDSRLKRLAIEPRFDVRRMEKWSLGVDGASAVERDLNGRPIGGSFVQRVRQSVADRSCRQDYRPSIMVDRWAEAFIESVQRFGPSENDRLVINTGGDFQVLALVEALSRLDQLGTVGELTIHVIFHFAVFDGSATHRAKAFGRQVNQALSRVTGHRVLIHATTDALNRQLAAVGIESTPLHYPTRRRDLVGRQRCENEPTKVVLAGMPRAEKGRGLIKSVLRSIAQSHLRTGNVTWSMQMPQRRWRRYIPRELHDLYLEAADSVGCPAFEAVHGNLTSEDYHDWLDTADVGLFLYDPDRYVARCSGVLLEMMIRGTPVIVPEGCWLADKVRSVGDAGPVGWIYRSPEELPGLLDEVTQSLDQVRAESRRNATEISRLHSGANALVDMGVVKYDEMALKAAG